STAAAGGEPLDVPRQPPERLTQLWRAASPATPEPVGHGSTVVTGEGGTVTGRDAQTGKQRWFYRRDLPLCTVGSAWSAALAVYRKSAGCSEVAKFDPATGRLEAQRNGDAELGTRLISDGSHVLTTGRKLLNVWGEDLIRAMEYGSVPAPVEPNRQLRPGCTTTTTTSSSTGQVETATPESLSLRCITPPGRQPRTGCTFGSTAMAAGKIAVVERCPGDRSEWLTVIGTTNEQDGENKSDQPKVLLSVQLPGEDARVVGVARTTKPRAAVVLPHTRQLLIYGQRDKLVSQFGLDLPREDLLAEPPGRTPQITRGTSSILWFTGSATLAMDDQTLRPRWTLPGTRGSGVLWAGSTLMPIDGGLAVIDEKTGEPSRTLAVDRRGYTGPVQLDYVGPVLLEQRGETLVALG
ncbi:MAG: Rv3212 family protein, partial [Thermocrispum sp.]